MIEGDELSNSDILLGADPSARLDTGMKVAEAVQRTQGWWNTRGRHMMLDKKARQKDATGTPFASPDSDDDNFLPSGIINGLEWDALTKREKLRLIKFWHHFFVRNQDVIGSDAHQYKFGKGDTIQ